MARKNKKFETTERMAEVTGLFLDNLTGKGPVDAVERSMTFHERRQMDDALTAIFSGRADCADNVGTPVLPGQVRLPAAQAVVDVAGSSVKLAEMFARAALRIMPEADLARMMPARMLEPQVLDGLEDGGAHTLARLGRRALTLLPRAR